MKDGHPDVLALVPLGIKLEPIEQDLKGEVTGKHLSYATFVWAEPLKTHLARQD